MKPILILTLTVFLTSPASLVAQSKKSKKTVKKKSNTISKKHLKLIHKAFPKTGPLAPHLIKQVGKNNYYIELQDKKKTVCKGLSLSIDQEKVLTRPRYWPCAKGKKKKS